MHEFFHLIFPCTNIFCTSPPPPPRAPHKFSNGPSLRYSMMCCAINRADHGCVCESRGWKLNNWITIIPYSLLFSSISNFSVIFIIHSYFFMSVFLFKFPFCELQTKEIKTVITFDSITKEENRTAKTR